MRGIDAGNASDGRNARCMHCRCMNSLHGMCMHRMPGTGRKGLNLLHHSWYSSAFSASVAFHIHICNASHFLQFPAPLAFLASLALLASPLVSLASFLVFYVCTFSAFSASVAFHIHCFIHLNAVHASLAPLEFLAALAFLASPLASIASLASFLHAHLCICGIRYIPCIPGIPRMQAAVYSVHLNYLLV